MEGESSPKPRQPEAVTKQPPQLDVPLKQDVLDLKSTQAKLDNVLIGVSNVSAYLLYYGYLLASHDYVGYQPIIFSPIVDMAARGAGALISEIKMRKLTQKESISSKQLGYGIDRLVYKGEKFESRGANLRTGDNIFMVNLPQLNLPKGEEPNTQQLGLMADFYSFALNDIRGRLSGKDYSAIAIDVGTASAIQASSVLRNADQIPRAELLEKANLKVKNPERQMLIIPREVFEEMSLDKRAIFEEAVDALEMSSRGKLDVTNIVYDLRNLREASEADRLATAQQIISKLDRLFLNEAQNLHNTFPIITRDRFTHIPLRQPLHPIIKTAQRSDGVYLQTISFTDGTKTYDVKLDLPLDQIIAAGDKNQNLMLSYYLSQMLSDIDTLDEITRITPPDEATMLKTLTDQNIVIEPTTENRSAAQAVKTKRLGNTVRSIVFSLLYMGALGAGTRGIELNSRYNTNTTPPLAQRDSIIFPETIPQSNPDWKLETHGDIASRGYYLLSTSSEYKDGAWIVNTSRENAVELNTAELANSIPQDGSYISLTKAITLNLQGNADFKLPIREHSTLGALQVTDINGKQIDPSEYKVIRLEDGTIEVIVSRNPFSPIGTVRIKEYLVDTNDPTVMIHAIKPIDINWHEDLLSPQVQDLLRKARQLPHETVYLLSLIRRGQYSINPSNKNLLINSGNTPEEKLNAMMALTGSDCEIADSAYAFLASIDHTNDDGGIEFVNIARGWTIGNTPSGSNVIYFNDLVAHEVNIEKRGYVVDATPLGSISDDKMTQDYLKAVADSGSDNTKADSFWEKKQQSLIKEEQDRERLMETFEIALGLTLSVAGGYAGLKAGKFIKGNIPSREEWQQYRAQQLTTSVLNKYTLEQLQEAIKFFGWISWGYSAGGKYPKDENIDPNISKDDLLNKLHWDRFHKERLRTYLHNHREYERQAGITDSHMAHDMQRLAQLLMRFK